MFKHQIIETKKFDLTKVFPMIDVLPKQAPKQLLHHNMLCKTNSVKTSVQS